MDLIARKRFRYRGRMLQAGDPFQADRKHGKLLVATRRAELGSYVAPKVIAVEKAREVKVPPPAPAPANLPSLKGKSKAKLLEIADAEGVSLQDREASNSVISAAIQAKRDAAS